MISNDDSGWTVSFKSEAFAGAIDADNSTSVTLLVTPFVRLLEGNRVRMSLGVDDSGRTDSPPTSFSDLGLN
jgi:hypothetical protein